MYLRGEKEKEEKSRVKVSVWTRKGSRTKKGRKSMTFSVEDTTIEELAALIKETIRNQKG